MTTDTKTSPITSPIDALAGGARAAAEALRQATGALDIPGSFFLSPQERMTLLEAGASDILGRTQVSPEIQRMAEEFAENERIHLAVSGLTAPSPPQRPQGAPGDYDLRCRRKKHMRVLAGASGLVEVACRNCRVSAGRDAVHTFDLATGEIVDTTA